LNTQCMLTSHLLSIDSPAERNCKLMDWLIEIGW